MNKSDLLLPYSYKKEEKQIRKVKPYCILVILLLSGCVRPESGIQIKNDTNVDGQEVEQVFLDDERVVSAVAVIHEENIISGVTVKTFSRFNKEKIEKELKEKLEQAYSDFEITVSTDRKILLETTKIFKKESDEKRSEEIKKVKSLLEEET